MTPQAERPPDRAQLLGILAAVGLVTGAAADQVDDAVGGLAGFGQLVEVAVAAGAGDGGLDQPLLGRGVGVVTVGAGAHLHREVGHRGLGGRVADVGVTQEAQIGGSPFHQLVEGALVT